MQLHNNRILRFGGLLPLCLCGLLLGQSADQPIPGERCSASTVVGTYAFANEGFVYTPPLAAPGVSIDLISIDAQGVLSGRGVGSIGLMPVAEGVDAGVIQVNDDCTAHIAWQLPFPGPGAVVILGGGKEMRSIGVGAAPLAWRGTWKRISTGPNPAECSPQSVRGVYMVNEQGWIASGPPPSFAPAVSIGTFTIDREGSIDGGGTFVLPPTPAPYEISGGKIEVHADCTASLQMGAVTGRAVVLEQGDFLWGIQTSAEAGKPIISTVWTRVAKTIF